VDGPLQVLQVFSRMCRYASSVTENNNACAWTSVRYILTYADVCVVGYPHYPPYAGIVERAIEKLEGTMRKLESTQGYRRETISRNLMWPKDTGHAISDATHKSSVLWHDMNSAMKIGSEHGVGLKHSDLRY